MTRVLILSVVPSPYQRDLFRALAKVPTLQLQVCYMERHCAGYPWPQEPLAPWESVLPGRKFDKRELRVHLNTRLPNFDEYDVVIINAYITAITTQWVMRRSLLRSKWVFWGERVRAQESSLKQWIQNMLMAPIKRASAIAAIGRLAVDDYTAKCRNAAVYNIPYHCELKNFMSFPRKPNSPKVRFLFCGVMSRRKGVDLLVRSFDRLVKTGAHGHLMLAGQRADLDNFLQDASPEARGRIDYLGFQRPDDLPEVFANADVFVLPSRHDGWGVVVNQALGAGLPIVCSDAVGAGYDLVEPEVNGLRVRAGDESALYACLKRFTDSPKLCREWGQQSRRKANDWLPESGAAKWVSAINEVLSAPKS